MANKKTDLGNKKVVLRGEMNKQGQDANITTGEGDMKNENTGINSYNAVDYGDIQTVKKKIQKKGYKKAKKEFY